MSNFFVTGATGLIGAAVSAELLMNGHTVYALCRGADHSRVKHAIETIRPSIDWTLADLITITGDIVEPNMGFSQETMVDMSKKIDGTIHCAGLTKFDALDDQNKIVNYEGTCNVVQVHKTLGWGRFVQISTIFVCGTTSGDIYERPIVLEQTSFNNAYEKSKAITELMLQKCVSDLAIVRPSIVVGTINDRWQGSTPVTYTGYYGFLESLYRMKQKMTGGMLDLNGTRIPGNLAATINLVNIDFVAQVIVACALAEKGRNEIYHACALNPPAYKWILPATLKMLDIYNVKAVDFVEFTNPSTLESAIYAGIQPFMPYITKCRRFDMTNTLKLIERKPLDMTSDVLNEITKQAIHQNFGRGPLITSE